MNKTKKFGIFFIAIAFIFALFEKLSSWSLVSYLTKKSCGDMYMIEPNPILREQGVLSDAACGFDADMQTVVIVFALLLWGVALLLLSLRKK